MIYDVAIIGAGFFGIKLASMFAAKKLKVILIEQEDDICKHASGNNQARVHNGYHYPRSLSTLISSHRHYERFIREFKDCVSSDYKSIYALAKDSLIDVTEFESLCNAYKMCCEVIDDDALNFNLDLIERVYLTQEAVFDISKIKQKFLNDLKENNIELRLNSRVENIEFRSPLLVRTAQESISARRVFNVTYAGINSILEKLGLDILEFKLELAEICLVEIPEDLKQYGITVMDGPFFSTLPFPSKNCYSLSHVKYTPHAMWYEKDVCRDPYLTLKEQFKSNFELMKNDASRYLPRLAEMKYIDSIYEVKTILSDREIDDGRPVVYKEHSDQFVSVLGSKIDSIYDLEEYI